MVESYAISSAQSLFIFVQNSHLFYCSNISYLLSRSILKIVFLQVSDLFLSLPKEVFVVHLTFISSETVERTPTLQSDSPKYNLILFSQISAPCSGRAVLATVTRSSGTTTRVVKSADDSFTLDVRVTGTGSMTGTLVR